LKGIGVGKQKLAREEKANNKKTKLDWRIYPTGLTELKKTTVESLSSQFQRSPLKLDQKNSFFKKRGNQESTYYHQYIFSDLPGKIAYVE
jgi:hypothetical protein